MVLARRTSSATNARRLPDISFTPPIQGSALARRGDARPSLAASAASNFLPGKGGQTVPPGGLSQASSLLFRSGYPCLAQPIERRGKEWTCLSRRLSSPAQGQSHTLCIRGKGKLASYGRSLPQDDSFRSAVSLQTKRESNAPREESRWPFCFWAPQGRPGWCVRRFPRAIAFRSLGSVILTDREESKRRQTWPLAKVPTERRSSLARLLDCAVARARLTGRARSHKVQNLGDVNVVVKKYSAIHPIISRKTQVLQKSITTAAGSP